MPSKFTRAIVRQPGRSMVRGLTTANLGVPDFEKAQRQHCAYVQALLQCGLTVIYLPADESNPDSTFVEDTALLTPACAIIMRSGAETRRGETEHIENPIRDFFPFIHRVEAPGTADAGDIMAVGRHYYIGISERTNEEGARQIIEILQRHGMTGSTISVGQGLHMKSGVSYLENDTVLVTDSFRAASGLSQMRQIPVSDDEQYAANSLWINDTVLVPSGFPKTERAIQSCGYKTISLDVSEISQAGRWAELPVPATLIQLLQQLTSEGRAFTAYSAWMSTMRSSVSCGRAANWSPTSKTPRLAVFDFHLQVAFRSIVRVLMTGLGRTTLSWYCRPFSKGPLPVSIMP